MRYRIALATLAGVLLMAPAAGASGHVVIDDVDVSSYPEVGVTVSLPGTAVGDEILSFTVTENGSVREATVSLAASKDLKVVLLLDISASMRGTPLISAKAAATQFVQEMPAGVEMAVISFGNAPALATEFTADKETLVAAIDGLIARGETALYDGLTAASQLLQAEEGGRTIILVSDGGDTVSNASLEEAQAALSGLEVDLYAIALESPEFDGAILETLAVAANGTVAAADDFEALQAVFGDVAARLLSSYLIEFESEAAGLADLEITVESGGTILVKLATSVELPIENVAPPATTLPPTVEAQPLPDPRPGVAIELSWLESSSALWLAAAALFASLLGAFLLFSAPSKRPSSLSPDVTDAAAVRRSAIAALADQATNLADHTLQHGDRLMRLNASLEQAGVSLRPGEFVVLVASIVLGVGAFGFVFFGPFFGLLLAGVVVALVPMYLSRKAEKRSALFGEQLSDSLQLMAASLRAGYGLLQAIEAVATEAPSPTAEEFQRIKTETHLGRDLGDSLNATAARVRSEDFKWVAEAIEIHRQIGGDLAEILDAVNETIRDRNRIRRRIKALSAEGRISGVILSLIPIVLVIIISFINPAYLGELVTTGLGRILIVAGVIAWFIAVGWMRRIIRLEF